VVDRKKNIFKLAQGQVALPREDEEHLHPEPPELAQCFVHGEDRAKAGKGSLLSLVFLPLLGGEGAHVF